jgi:hypothetical protein
VDLLVPRKSKDIYSHSPQTDLQAEQWKNKQKWQQERDNEQWQSARAEASNKSSHDHGEHREAHHETASSVAILNENSGSFHPHQRIAGFQIHRLSMHFKVKIRVVVIGIFLQDSFVEIVKLCDGSLLWINPAA